MVFGNFDHSKLRASLAQKVFGSERDFACTVDIADVEMEIQNNFREWRDDYIRGTQKMPVGYT